jgi:3-deoxy-D-manno-octulosonic-acid transferase
MIWFYRLLYLPGLLIALPYYGLRMWRRGGYRKDFQHRFGRFRRLAPAAAGKKRIWLQAVSVGEILAIGPLIDALQANGDIEIVLTTTTSTGYVEARKRYKASVLAIGIFPLDFWLFSRTAWARIQPDAVILTESELWPEHLHQARKRGVPAFLVNARISDTSFKRYKQMPALAKRLLGKLDHVFAASDLDQERLIELGVDAARLASTGSIKFDVPIGAPLSSHAKQALRTELGFTSENQTTPFVLLGSSTWPGEEATLLQVQDAVIKAGVDCRLLLVPRHAERAPDITRLLASQPRTWHQRSTKTELQGPLSIHLADTTGELARLSQAADLAFIGKSLAPNIGGQTPIEAASLGLPILMGPNMNNFKAVSKSLLTAGAAQVVQDAEHLQALVLKLVADQTTRDSMSAAGRDWHDRSKGSSQRIATAILAALDLERVVRTQRTEIRIEQQ